MKKKLCIVLLSFVVILYLGFLFVLPNVINLNNYKNALFDFVKEQTELQISADNLKLYTTPAFKVGVKTENLKISYSDESILASMKNANIRLKLIPFLWKNLQLDLISADAPTFNDVLQQNGSTKFEDFLNNFLSKQSNDTPSENNTQSSFITLSAKLPKIEITNYKLNLFDVTNKQNLVINGDNLFIAGNLDKNIVVKTLGTFNVNDKKIIGYNFNIDTIIPSGTDEKKEDTKTEQINIDLTPISKIVSKKFHSDINVDLKIREKDKKTIIQGFANISNLEFLVKNQVIKDNKIKIEFDNDKINFSSNFNFANNEKLSAIANIKTGKKVIADIDIDTEKLDITNIFDTCISLLEIANVKNDLKDFNLSGVLKSDLTIHTDMKKITANGALNLANVNLSHKKFPLKITNTNTVLNAVKNKLNIEANATVNSSKIKVIGGIDKNTNTKLSVKSDVLPLNILFNSFAPNDIKKLYAVKSGNLIVNFSTNGKLNKLTHNLKLDLSKLNFYDKTNKITLINDKTKIDLKTDLKTYSGKIQISSVSANIPQVATIKLPKAEIIFDEKDITLKNSVAYLNGSAINFNGKINDYIKKLQFNFTADGNIKTLDIKKMLPKEYSSCISAIGVLPIIARINGDLKTLTIQAQTLANGTNNFSVLNIKELKNQNTIANLKISTDYKNLNLDDISLSKANISTLSQNAYENNLNNSTKFIVIDGTISDVLAKKPLIKNVDISIPTTINATLPIFAKSNLSVNGKLNVSGYFDNLKINGILSIPNCSIPELLTKAENVDLSFNNNSLTIYGKKINLNDSVFEGTMDIKSIFDKIITIQTIKVNSTNFDADKLFVFVDKIYKAFPQTSSTATKQKTPALVAPLKIINGSGTIKNFSMKPLSINNVTGNFSLSNDIFKLNNLKMTAYEGNVAGNLSYNLKNLAANCDFKGNGLNVNPFVTDFTGLKDQLTGMGNFSAKISFAGADYKTQMKTLKGSVDFNVNNGQLGSWGRFENYINAQNLKGINNFTNELNKITTTLSPKNSGQFDTLTGHITLNNGFANLQPVKMTGKLMSLYLIGKFNLLNNDLQLDILGNVSKELTSALGGLNNLYPTNIVSKAQSIGNAASSLMGIYTQIADKQTFAKIPSLSSNQTDSSAFIVKLNGNIATPATAVKSFKWLSTSADFKTAKAALLKIFVKSETQKTVQTTGTSTIKNIGNDILKSVQTQTQTTTEKINKDAQEVQQKTQQATEAFKNKSTEAKVESVLGVINKLKTQQQGTGNNGTGGI